MKTEKLYRFRVNKQRGNTYQVMFKHIPNKWISTGTADITEAVLFAENKVNKDLYGRGADDTKQTLREFTRDMFTNVDRYSIRKRDIRYGRSYKSTYYDVRQAYIDNYINKKFGDYLLSAISDVAIEDWLLDLKSLNGSELSSNAKNKILIVFRKVFQEAKRLNLISYNPADNVRMFTEHTKPRDIFTLEELQKMFPEDDDFLIKRWGGVMWATYFLIMRDTGFRPSEVSALSIDNYYPNLHGLYSQCSVDWKTRQIQQSIKTSNKGKNYKVGILTDQTERILKLRIAECKANEEKYLFKIKDRFIEPCTSNKHFRMFSPVSTDGRTQYCLRHSFETHIAGKVENKITAELMAHTAFNPTYDHRDPKQILEQLQPFRDVIEKI